MLEIPRDEPSACHMGKREEWHVLRVRPAFGPGCRVRKAQAFLNQKFQPIGRKPVAVELRTPDDFPILANNPRTGDQLDLPLQHPICAEFCRGTSRLDTGGYEDVGVEDNQSHLVFPRWRTTRT